MLDWAGKLMLDPTLSGFFLRKEFQVAMDTAINYFKNGKTYFPTKITEEQEEDCLMDEDAMQIDQNAPLPPFQNLFLNLAPNCISR